MKISTKTKRAFFSALLLSTAIATPTLARGGCNCAAISAYHNTTRNVVSAEHDETREQVKTSIEQQTDDLRDHLDVKTQELIDALMGQARENSNFQQMQVEASQRIEDAAQVNATNRLRDEFRAEAESGAYDPNPFSCLLVDIFKSGTGGGFTPGSTGSAVASSVEAWVDGSNPIVQAGGAELSKHVADKRDEFAGFRGSSNATTDWGLLLDKPTLDLSDEDMAEVASIIIRNGIDSTPDRSVTPEERLTPAGLDRIAAIEEKSSRIGSAIQNIMMALNMRSNVMDGEPVETFRGLAEDSAYNRDITEKLSELQQIDIMTVWNYAPAGDRLLSLSGAHTGENAELNINSDTQWLFEIHRILSLNARINYLQLELANRDAIVNANILATLNDDD